MTSIHEKILDICKYVDGIFFGEYVRKAIILDHPKYNNSVNIYSGKKLSKIVGAFEDNGLDIRGIDIYDGEDGFYIITCNEEIEEKSYKVNIWIHKKFIEYGTSVNSLRYDPNKNRYTCGYGEVGEIFKQIRDKEYVRYGGVYCDELLVLDEDGYKEKGDLS